MRLFKVKIDKTIKGKVTEIEHPYNSGYCIQVQAVMYGSSVPAEELRLFDAGGDEFMFSIPGQSRQGRSKVTSPEDPVTVRLPLAYYDSEGDNELIIWGEVYELESNLPTTF